MEKRWDGDRVLQEHNSKASRTELLHSQLLPHEQMHVFLLISIDDNDVVYVASDYPYTYTDLSRLTNSICTSSYRDRVRLQPLCKTLAGNVCPMYIITNFNSTPIEISNRSAIVLTARVHPGYGSTYVITNSEANGSFVIEGVVRYLVGNADGANRLRNTYVLKVSIDSLQTIR